MWKLHRKLNFPKIFRLAAIHTWAPAFNTIAINELYIDRVEDNAYSVYAGVMKFTILVDSSLVIITLYLVCLIYV